MRAGRFDLRGWEYTGDESDKESSLVLGLLWNKRNDTLAINPNVLNIEIPEIVTKRIILSATYRVFDPIGVTSPVSLQPKLLLKDLWAEKLDWDTKVVGEKKSSFLSWLRDLKNLNRDSTQTKYRRIDTACFWRRERFSLRDHCLCKSSRGKTEFS